MPIGKESVETPSINLDPKIVAWLAEFHASHRERGAENYNKNEKMVKDNVEKIASQRELAATVQSDQLSESSSEPPLV